MFFEFGQAGDSFFELIDCTGSVIQVRIFSPGQIPGDGDERALVSFWAGQDGQVEGVGQAAVFAEVVLGRGQLQVDAPRPVAKHGSTGRVPTRDQESEYLLDTGRTVIQGLADSLFGL